MAEIKISKYTEDPSTRMMVDFADGDDGVFENIVRHFDRQVYGTIYRYLGNSSMAEDCAQEVFMRLYKMRASYRPTARLSTLIYRITTNLCLNTIRDQSRRRMVSLDARSHADERPLKASLCDDGAAEASVHAEADERARIVRDALDRIPPRQRMALVLHRFEGLTYADIADTMSINVAAVKSLLSRARNSLADALRSDLENGNI